MNSTLRTLLFGYFGSRIYRPGLHFSLASVSSNLRFGAWLTADQHHQLHQYNLSTGCFRTLGLGVAGGYLAWNVWLSADKAETRLSPACCFRRLPKSRKTAKNCRLILQAAVSGLGLSTSGTTGTDGGVGQRGATLVFGEKWNGIIPVWCCYIVGLLLPARWKSIGSLLMAAGRYRFKINVFKNDAFIPYLFSLVIWQGNWRGH